MFFILLGIFVNSALSQSLTGFYTEEEIRTFHPLGSPDKVVLRKSWYAGDRMVKDEGVHGTTIARFDRGKIYLLDSHTETYIEVGTDFIRGNAQQGLAPFGLRDEEDTGSFYFPEDLYIRTETTKRIGPWSCYQVAINPKYRSPDAPYAVFWYSTDVNFPVQVYGDQLKKLFGNAPEVEGLFSRLQEFEGYPVRSESHQSENVVVTTLIKIEQQDEIDPNLFDIPKNYRGVPLPDKLPDLIGNP